MSEVKERLSEVLAESDDSMTGQLVADLRVIWLNPKKTRNEKVALYRKALKAATGEDIKEVEL